MTIKEILSASYFSLSLFALVCEPSENLNLSIVIIYYSIAFLNLGIASLILKKVIKKQNDTATNRN